MGGVCAVLDGQDTIPLISIPEWDFNWQGIFTYPQMVHVPAGYVVEAYGTYDNTSENPFNPYDPPQTMYRGDFTTEEMFVLFLQYVPYQEGEEDIVLSGPDNNTMVVYQHDNLFPAWPNPAVHGEVNVGFHLRQDAESDAVFVRHSRPRGEAVDSRCDHAFRPPPRNVQCRWPAVGTYIYRMRTSSGTVRSAQLHLH